jgi:hypothetical protein
MISIDKLPLHDSYILGIDIKTNTDHFDTITITLESSAYIDLYQTKTIKLNFKDCFKAKLDLQMWISGKDSIRSLDVLNEEKSIVLVNPVNKEFGPSANDLVHYHINLNISNSNIDIWAKDLEIKPVS